MNIATEQKFAIFEDIQGMAENVPRIKLSRVYSPDSENVHLRYGELRRMPGRSNGFIDGDEDLVQTTDGYEILRYHRHIAADGTEYVFAATKAHIYRWVQATTSFLTQHTCSSDCTLWDFESFNGKVVATNNIDKVLVWDESTPATNFAALGSASGLDLDGGATYLTKAKYVTSYENYLILGYTSEGGTSYPFRERWCSYGDETDFDETGTGDTGAKDFLSGSDVLKGFGHYDAYGSNLLVIFKEYSNYTQWLVESESVFQTAKGSDVGLIARHALENDKEGHLYYYASDYTIKKYKHGSISERIDRSLRLISPTYQDDICATFIDTYNQIWWSVPGSASSEGLDYIFAYDLNYEIWNMHDFAIRAFGRYSRQTSYTIDGLDAVSDTIDGLDAAMSSIDSVENIVGFELDIASDTSGYTYILHDSDDDMGEAHNGKFVITTDLADKQSLAWYKRISNIQLWFNGEGTSDYEVDVSAKEDRERSWQSLGTVSLNVDEDDGGLDFSTFLESEELVIVDIPCDLRAHVFDIKIESDDPYEFLGMIIDYVWDDDR